MSAGKGRTPVRCRGGSSTTRKWLWRKPMSIWGGSNAIGGLTLFRGGRPTARVQGASKSFRIIGEIARLVSKSRLGHPRKRGTRYPQWSGESARCTRIEDVVRRRLSCKGRATASFRLEGENSPEEAERFGLPQRSDWSQWQRQSSERSGRLQKKKGAPAAAFSTKGPLAERPRKKKKKEAHSPSTRRG